MWLEREKFVNPYNFVTLPAAPNRDTDAEQLKRWRGDLCGVIHCIATTRTPVALPDHSINRGDKANPDYPFFNIDGEYRIPGSELRGVVRSVFETVTDSCMGVLPDSSLSSRNQAQGKKAGILCKENGEWKLYEAEDFLFVTYTDNGGGFQKHPISVKNGKLVVTINGQEYRSGDVIKFHPGQKTYVTSRNVNTEKKEALFSNDDRENTCTGYVILGERGLSRSRHHSHVISKCSDKPMNNIDPVLLAGAVKNLQILLDDYYRNDKVNLGLVDKQDKPRNHYGYAGYSIQEEGTPVFYNAMLDSDGKMIEQIYLSPAIITREVHPYTLYDYAAENKPCSQMDWGKSKRKICPACALFGIISSHKERSYGGAIRFSDGRPDKSWGDADFERITLQILGGPKISAAEFYTKDYRRTTQGKVLYWNYGYYIMDIDKNKVAVRYNKLPQLRGRKFYFQQNEQKLDYSSERHPKQNYTTDLLMPKHQFSFDVYFDGISDTALFTLLWCISPFDPKDETAKLHLSIGSGKPLGLGSITVAIDSIDIRSIDNGSYKIEKKSAADYHEQIAATLLQTGRDKSLMELVAMLREDTVMGSRVCYPIGRDDRGPASHHWFTGNRAANLSYTLPMVQYGKLNAYYELPGYEKEARRPNAPANPTEPRTMYNIICADCGRPSQVPFRPSGDRPAYCRSCFQKHRR